ncbi:MAG: hypothetical protein AAGA71_21145 [Pseudomonadota bacterium]
MSPGQRKKSLFFSYLLTSLRKFAQKDGAGERTNLEPAQLNLVLEELEGWAAVLKSDPEVIHRLSAFAKAAANADGDDQVDAPDATQASPIDPMEPSP